MPIHAGGPRLSQTVTFRGARRDHPETLHHQDCQRRPRRISLTVITEFAAEPFLVAAVIKSRAKVRFRPTRQGGRHLIASSDACRNEMPDVAGGPGYLKVEGEVVDVCDVLVAAAWVCDELPKLRMIRSAGIHIEASVGGLSYAPR